MHENEKNKQFKELFEIKPNKQLEALEPSSFRADWKVDETKDFEEWIVSKPEALGEELLIIQRQFNKFDKTREKLDLLALDKKGNLVIIENKLDNSGKDVIWQALKYAAHCSNFDYDQIVEIFKDYLDSDIGNAEKLIRKFVNPDIKLNDGAGQRVILVAGYFPLVITSTVLWLIRNKIDIQCVKMTPYELEGKRLLSSHKIIPPPEAEDYMVNMASKELKERKEKSEYLISLERNFKFWCKLQDYFQLQEFNPYENVALTRGRVIFAPSKKLKGCVYDLYFTNDILHVTLRLIRKEKEENKIIFEFLKAKAIEINIEGNFDFDNEIQWKPKTPRISCESQKFKGDNHNEENWDEIIKWYHANVKKMHEVFEELLEKAKDELKL